MEDYGLLPIHRDEITRIYNEWNHGGHFLRTASRHELMSIDVLNLIVHMEVENLQSSYVCTPSGKDARELTIAKVGPAIGYVATRLIAAHL